MKKKKDELRVGDVVRINEAERNHYTKSALRDLKRREPFEITSGDGGVYTIKSIRTNRESSCPYGYWWTRELVRDEFLTQVRRSVKS